MTVDDRLLLDCATAALARPESPQWTVRPEEFWCYMEPPAGRRRTQGWKLHLSATPLSAPLVLARAAEVLLRRECPFKFAATLARVEELGSRRCDRGSGGKFLTAYPDCAEDELLALAEELHQVTAGLPGPGILSDRPYRPGSLVHYRFGAFTGVRMLGNDGADEAMLIAPDGSLVLDQRKAWFTLPPWAPRDPFREPVEAGSAAPKPVLLDGRFLVTKVLRHAFTGGVYLGVEQETGAEVIIKQARPHAGAGLSGQDIRDRRRHEEAMLRRFAASGHTAKSLGVFEQQGELFLVQEALPGSTLRQWVSDTQAPFARTREVALGLVELLELVHEAGYVARDFTPNNVLVLPDGSLRLIDLELLAEPGTGVSRSHTPAYGAPEQAGAASFGPAPAPTADLFSLGATLFYLVSGTDPLLPADSRPTAERIENWLHLLNPAARLLAPIIVALLHADPDRRPPLAEVRAFLAALEEPQPSTSAPSRIEDGDLDRLLADGFAHLLSTMDSDAPVRLWPTNAFGATTDPLNVQHGAAGVLAVLTRAAATTPELTAAVDTAATWIARRIDREPRTLPGLYFGRSGTAWALLEAAELLGDGQLRHLAGTLARRVPLRWPNPDICHGVAGAGLTQLRFWEATGEEEFLTRTREAAETMVTAAEHRDGHLRWPIPAGFSSRLAGVVHYGFAHGVAGAGAFLLAAATATGESAYLDLATAAADTLAAAARFDRGGAYWPSAESGGPARTNWCSGSSGVGTFLARLWQRTGEDRHAALAVQAAVAVRRSRWQAGLSQCHGLAGDAEFLLDLAEVTGDKGYRDWAAELAAAIHARNTLRAGRLVLPDESGTEILADFNTGLSGTLSFLLRLRDGGPRPWLPALLTGTQR
ncbi:MULTISPECIES: class IV lanthionine synthetase LanL [unclassified Crossiella]|uniref:class IV lanthionine synthetase LanL n=1 Tax=unclassified Crossiella TaxID=2620835 RepID=UPI001FFE7552|nr:MULTISPECIES: class IV lanthionine synthetase LanL [unclassified Crossiella]MCK2244159.1 class IV lanthionine synthetase LanL [Crossiella sp. S99.2]MCK2257963.1 class IV lanthionine synthetase LanL [Crossiella sp. S99.1]